MQRPESSRGTRPPEAIAAGSMRCPRLPALRPYFLCGLRPDRSLRAADRRTSPRRGPFGRKRRWMRTMDCRRDRRPAVRPERMQIQAPPCVRLRRQLRAMPSHRFRSPRGPGFLYSVPLPSRDPFVSSPLLFLLHADSVPCSSPCAGSMPVFFVPLVVTALRHDRPTQPIDKLSFSCRGTKNKHGGYSFAEFCPHGVCHDKPAIFSSRRQRFPVVFLAA
jgi:hypothetical protein